MQTRSVFESICSSNNHFNKVDAINKNITNYLFGTGGGGATAMFINSLPVIIAGGGGGVFPINFFNNISSNIQ